MESPEVGSARFGLAAPREKLDNPESVRGQLQICSDWDGPGARQRAK